MHRRSSSDSVDLLHSQPPYNILDGRKDVSCHYNFPTLEAMVGAVTFVKQVIKLGAHGRMFRSVLQLVQRYKMPSKARGGGGEDITTRQGDSKKNAVFEIDGVPLHYTEKEQKLAYNILSRKAHPISLSEQAVRLC